jgi:hypothetical protein
MALPTIDSGSCSGHEELILPDDDWLRHSLSACHLIYNKHPSFLSVNFDRMSKEIDEHLLRFY